MADHLPNPPAGTDDDRPRWFSQTPETHSQWYVDRFRELAAEGADLAGEARFVDAVVSPGARVLDAGCGPGRLAGALHERGHDVVGVDVDPVLLAAAEADHAGPRWERADLATLDLGETFDAVVSAGNVLVFLAPGTEDEVVQRMAGHVAPGGVLVVGFRLDRHVTIESVEAAARAGGLEPEHRFSTWDLRPWSETADFVVAVLRRPGSDAA
ncbi:class I SAM-dependent methyltransferase [Aeromicrobium sp. CF4.19]|uniref:class I SAM-dependent methyltransferase n=1 Tax=Aeromicrobium sp. CF4.19 TaxID=3373082 RepID=UPI003EE48104